MKTAIALGALIAVGLVAGCEAPQDRRAREELPSTVKGLERQIWDLETRVIALEKSAGIKHNTP